MRNSSLLMRMTTGSLPTSTEQTGGAAANALPAARAVVRIAIGNFMAFSSVDNLSCGALPRVIGRLRLCAAPWRRRLMLFHSISIGFDQLLDVAGCRAWHDRDGFSITVLPATREKSRRLGSYRAPRIRARPTAFA